MTAMELMTAAEFNVKVKVLVFNNNFQGMVKVLCRLLHVALLSSVHGSG